MEKIYTDNHIRDTRGYTMILESPYIMTGREYYDRYTSGKSYSGVPGKIQEMLDLYEYGDGSFQKKCEVFLRQGLFMKDYEDSALWYGDLRRYFPTYHDLNIRQLRGYFAWRTEIRKGKFERTCESFAYIYIYELLNGIGTGSPEESFEKLEEFYRGYIDMGMGDPPLKKNLRRWMSEYAVIHRMPKETVLRYADPGKEERAHIISVLRSPEGCSDEEVLRAIKWFSNPKLMSSPVLTKYPEKGSHLFCEVWRHLSKDQFTRCFGEVTEEPWHPMAGAVFCEQEYSEDMEYVLDDCRRYMLKNGEWKEARINSLTSDRDAFLHIMHMTDLMLRRMFRTGGYLRKKQGEDFAEEIVSRALEDIRKEEAEAARPKVRIDLSGLDKIREDAGATRDSLLTEEETLGDEAEAEEAVISSTGLDSVQTAVLKALLKNTGEEASFLAENHIMPEILADQINEALFDDIGDSVVECENDRLTIVEDYIEDLRGILGA